MIFIRTVIMYGRMVIFRHFRVHTSVIFVGTFSLIMCFWFLHSLSSDDALLVESQEESFAQHLSHNQFENFDDHIAVSDRIKFPRKPVFRYARSAELRAELLHMFEQQMKVRSKDIQMNTDSSIRLTCQHPNLDLRHDNLSSAFYPLDSLECDQPELFYLVNNTLFVNKSVLGKRMIKKCLYRGIERVSDDFASYTGSFVQEQEPFDVRVLHDFVHVKCIVGDIEDNTRQNSDENQRQYSLHKKEIQLHQERGKLMSKVANSDTNNRLLHLSEQKVNPNILFYGKNRSSFHSDAALKDLDELNMMSLDNGSHGGQKHVIADNAQESYNYKDDDDGPDSSSEFNDNPDADMIEQFVVQTIPKMDVFNRINEYHNNMNIKPEKKSHAKKFRHNASEFVSFNVLVLVLDSMSHLAYQRKLPKTYDYLKKTLGAAVMNGYNVVGDATLANLLPLLTGKNESELPDSRRGHSNSVFADKFPLLFYNFRDHGYATLYAEDEPEISTFNLGLNGFQEQPTDHYMRSFWQTAVRADIYGAEQFCLGNRPSHQYTLDYTKDFFTQYRNVSKFAFLMFVKLTHADNNPGQYIDEDFVKMFDFLKKDGHIDNTFVLVMSDHGARYTKVRWTLQGKFEERLPMMSIAIPRKFQNLYPKLRKNMFKNVNRLTTPYDIHETLKDIIDLQIPQNSLQFTRKIPDNILLSRRGISLFRHIPSERTCKLASISTHWCTCLMFDMDRESVHVRDAANIIIDHINTLTKDYRSKCVQLTLKAIRTAMFNFPNNQEVRLTGDGNSAHYIVPDLHEAFLQITIETLPNDALYEATMRVDFTRHTVSLDAEVSRVNRYGSQPDCIKNVFPELRKYCYCLTNFEFQALDM